uniref:Uncharacterized protein n=1 Tax=Octopus bimaculoides TaxID=37653 RepID=A0A0L8FLA5_OCTBM
MSKLHKPHPLLAPMTLPSSLLFNLIACILIFLTQPTTTHNLYICSLVVLCLLVHLS